MRTSRPAMGEEGTTQRPGSGLWTTTPRSASVRIVISMCGMLGSVAPVCRSRSPWANRGAASSRPETNWLEADASMAISPPGTSPVP
ncbi:hypothetical protein CMMCAS05_10435 [Clavibacter michiganensis subsp. michiganensis]|nr:hypothetical protein CMMCAS05_10435 [Clavibacter michiganensis subsp. michiganensis]OUE05310.1 hypothetical protein CMMCAS04_00415 [Clavibacter michiganensis subsp. michiganensis]